MSDAPEASNGNQDLQFDHAEIAEPSASTGLTCAGCRQAVLDDYYQVNGRIACASCRNQILTSWKGGSGVWRTVKAVGAGLLATAVGAGIYYGVTAVTGLRIGLVAVVVGLLVGGAVRWGSGGRGGLYYQLIAVVMTYVAIAASYSVFEIQALLEHSPQRVHQSSTYQRGSDHSPAESSTEDTEQDSDHHKPMSLAAFLLGLGEVLGILLALPVLYGMQSPIGLIIAAFALFEAWKINKAPRLVVSGPYQAPAPSMSPAAQTSYPAGTDV